MEIIKKDDPVTLSEYAFGNNLIDKKIWKWASRYAKNFKKMNWMVRNLPASKRALRDVKYQFVVIVPRKIQEAYKMEEANVNTLWTNSIEKEVKLIWDDFECFHVTEKNEVTDAYQNIPLTWTFAIKFDGRHSVRLCAGGNITSDL